MKYKVKTDRGSVATDTDIYTCFIHASYMLHTCFIHASFNGRHHEANTNNCGSGKQTLKQDKHSPSSLFAKHQPDTHQTPTKHPPDTNQTPPKHYPDTTQTPPKHPRYLRRTTMQYSQFRGSCVGGAVTT